MHEMLRDRVIAEAKRLRAQDVPWTDVAREVSKLAGRPAHRPFDESTIRKLLKADAAKPSPPSRRTVEIELRGPRGWSPPTFDALWQDEREELHELACEAETAEERLERSVALARHDYPEIGAWEAYSGGDVVDALYDSGLATALDLDLVANPDALASLVLRATESPSPSKATRRRDRTRAVGLLEAALALVRKAPLDLEVAHRRRFPSAKYYTDPAPVPDGDADAEAAEAQP